MPLVDPRSVRAAVPAIGSISQSCCSVQRWATSDLPSGATAKATPSPLVLTTPRSRAGPLPTAGAMNSLSTVGVPLAGSAGVHPKRCWKTICDPRPFGIDDRASVRAVCVRHEQSRASGRRGHEHDFVTGRGPEEACRGIQARAGRANELGKGNPVALPCSFDESVLVHVRLLGLGDHGDRAH